jgi:hypothetical protein
MGGMTSVPVRRKLLKETELHVTLHKTLDICRAAETSGNHMKAIVESRVVDSEIYTMQGKN